MLTTLDNKSQDHTQKFNYKHKSFFIVFAFSVLIFTVIKNIGTQIFSKQEVDSNETYQTLKNVEHSNTIHYI